MSGEFWSAFKQLFRPKLKPCQHRNRKAQRWVQDNTPMIRVECEDCGKVIDQGHVYGDTEGWHGVTYEHLGKS